MTSTDDCAILNSINEREVDSMKLSMTYHAREERFDRLSALVEYLGVGEIVLEVPDRVHIGSIRCITDTGIMFIKSADNGVVITAFMASVPQVSSMYHQLGFNKMPRYLYQRIVQNNKKYAFLKEI